MLRFFRANDVGRIPTISHRGNPRMNIPEEISKAKAAEERVVEFGKAEEAKFVTFVKAHKAKVIAIAIAVAVVVVIVAIRML